MLFHPKNAGFTLKADIGVGVVENFQRREIPNTLWSLLSPFVFTFPCLSLSLSVYLFFSLTLALSSFAFPPPSLLPSVCPSVPPPPLCPVLHASLAPHWLTESFFVSLTSICLSYSSLKTPGLQRMSANFTEQHQLHLGTWNTTPKMSRDCHRLPLQEIAITPAH